MAVPSENLQSTDADTIRILVATDSHVGFEERDPIRKDDSHKSFDEVMQLAKTQDVGITLIWLLALTDASRLI
jgi:double-strand break repair protein MRE11